jgi:hypothetical protein
MALVKDQFQLALVEHDRNEDDLCVWNFPLVTGVVQSCCVRLASKVRLCLSMPAFWGLELALANLII